MRVQTVHHILQGRADLTPERIGCVLWEPYKTFSFRELDERARKVAAFISGLGARKGDRVVILARNGVHYVDLFFGLSIIGAIFVPINFRLAPPEIEHIVSDCQPVVFFFDPLFEETVRSVQKRSAVPHWISLEKYEETLPELPLSATKAKEIDPRDPHSILYTSGTTGRPKGAVLPHRMIVWNSINTIVSWGLKGEDSAAIFTPQFHSGGLNVLMVPLIHIGGRVVIPERFDPPEALRLIEREKITILFLVPSMFRALSEEPAFRTANLSSIRFAISGGAPCPEGIMDPFRKQGMAFRQGYGLTEAGVNCFTMTDEESVRYSGSVGRPVFHSEVRIVDSEGRDVRPDEVGELTIRGPHVFSGYWNNPVATSETIREGWFYTGDLAVARNGYYTIVGRKKEMYISGGENVYPAEVEQALLSHPKVADVAVIGIPDEKWGEVGRAIIVPKTGETATEDELKDHCQKVLARYKIPKSFRFSDALPRNAYGKVLREELRNRFGA